MDRGIIWWGKSGEVECYMAFSEQLTLAGLNARIEHLENQQDRLLHLMLQLIDLRIWHINEWPNLWSQCYGCPSTYRTCQWKIICWKEIWGISRANESRGSHNPNSSRISQPRQSQSKQNDDGPVRQMVPTWQVQEALEKFPSLPMPILQLYHILLKEHLVALILPRHIINSPLGESGPWKTCEHHFGSPGHSVEECKSLRGMIQGLLDNNIIQFQNATITNSSPTSCEGQVNVVIKNKGQRGSFISGLPMAPYPYGVPYPSLLLNKGNPGSDIS